MQVKSNLDRFKKDLEDLVSLGDSLNISMLRAEYPEEIDAQLEAQIGKEKLASYIKSLPEFNVSYERWYSEALVLLKQLLPDRVANFISLYEKPKARKEVKYGNYVIQDYLQGLRVTNGAQTVVESSAAIPQFKQQLAILKSAKARFESSLFEIRQLVQADLLDTEISGARELYKSKFFRAAGVIAGVVLEKHLHQVCDSRGIAIAKKAPGLSDLNELLRTNGVIDVPQWRQLSFLADIRNLCAHNKKAEPTAEQVTDLLDGAEKIIKTIA